MSHQGCTSRLHSSAAIQGRTPKATRHPRPPPILALRPVSSSRPNYRQGWADASTHRPAPVSPPTDLETSSIPPQRFRPARCFPAKCSPALRAVFCRGGRFHAFTRDASSPPRNFPHIMTLLSDTCKYSVVTSQMHRFNRRCFYAYDFINETVAYCRKLIKAGYNKLEVIAKVMHFKHWQPQKGKWEFVVKLMRRRILAIED